MKILLFVTFFICFIFVSSHGGIDDGHPNGNGDPQPPSTSNPTDIKPKPSSANNSSNRSNEISIGAFAAILALLALK